MYFNHILWKSSFVELTWLEYVAGYYFQTFAYVPSSQGFDISLQTLTMSLKVDMKTLHLVMIVQCFLHLLTCMPSFTNLNFNNKHIFVHMIWYLHGFVSGYSGIHTISFFQCSKCFQPHKSNCILKIIADYDIKKMIWLFIFHTLIFIFIFLIMLQEIHFRHHI